MPDIRLLVTKHTANVVYLTLDAYESNARGMHGIKVLPKQIDDLIEKFDSEQDVLILSEQEQAILQTVLLRSANNATMPNMKQSYLNLYDKITKLQYRKQKSNPSAVISPITLI